MNNNRILMKLIKNKKYDYVNEIIEKGDFSINYYNKNNETFLMLLCKNNKSELALKLLNIKSIKYTLNKKSKIDNYTALNYAKINKMNDVVFKILEYNI